MFLNDKKSNFRSYQGIFPSKESGEVLQVCWMLHNLCNHKCVYCHPNSYGGKHKNDNFALVELFLNKFFDHFSYKDNISFSLTGGEPTIWPNLLSFCRIINNSKANIGLTTNGSRSISFFEKLAPSLSWISLSFHPEFSRVEHFEKLIQLLSIKVPLCVRIMFPKQNDLWNKSSDFLNRLLKIKNTANFNIESVKVIDGFSTNFQKSTSYNDEQELYLKKNSWLTIYGEKPTQLSKAGFLGEFKFLKLNGELTPLNPNELVTNGMNKFKNWVCYAGLDQLFIDSKGDIWRSHCKIKGKIGNIQDKIIKFPLKPVTCTLKSCNCASDIVLKKMHYTKESNFFNKMFTLTDLF